MIATRTLEIKDGDITRELAIQIFAPSDHGNGWSCRYEIDWPEGRESMEIWGVDSVQAILLACQMIGSELYTSDYHESGRLMFDEPGQGYGFPVAGSLRDLLIGDDRKYM